MRTSSRTLIGFCAVAVVAIAIAVLLTRSHEEAQPLVVTTPAPAQPAPRSPVVLEEPPVVERAAETTVAPQESAPEPAVTRAEKYEVKDATALGPIHSPDADERAALEEKLGRFLKNQSEARRAQEPR